MATRIRYSNNEGTLVSKPLLSPIGELIVNIKSDGTFVINKTDGTSAHSETVGSDLAKAKKLAKLALKGLGVTFSEEIRVRVQSALATQEEEALNELAKDQ